MTGSVTFERNKGLANVRLDRRGNLNALDQDTILALTETSFTSYTAWYLASLFGTLGQVKTKRICLIHKSIPAKQALKCGLFD